MIRKDKRMSLISHREGVNLQIPNLHIDDAGNYFCEVEHEGEPIVQTNELQVLGNQFQEGNHLTTTFLSVPPKIATSHHGQNLTVRKDSR